MRLPWGVITPYWHTTTTQSNSSIVPCRTRTPSLSPPPALPLMLLMLESDKTCMAGLVESPRESPREPLRESPESTRPRLAPLTSSSTPRSSSMLPGGHPGGPPGGPPGDPPGGPPGGPPVGTPPTASRLRGLDLPGETTADAARTPPAMPRNGEVLVLAGCLLGVTVPAMPSPRCPRCPLLGARAFLRVVVVVVVVVWE